MNRHTLQLCMYEQTLNSDLLHQSIFLLQQISTSYQPESTKSKNINPRTYLIKRDGLLRLAFQVPNTQKKEKALRLPERVTAVRQVESERRKTRSNKENLSPPEVTNSFKATKLRNLAIQWFSKLQDLYCIQTPHSFPMLNISIFL